MRTTGRHRLHLPREGDGGFMMVELVVAALVFAIVSSGIMLSLFAALRNVSDAKAESVATNIAQSRIEEIRTISYNEVGVIASNPPGILADTEAVTIEGTEYLIAIDVEYVNDPAPGAILPGTDYKVVTVTVSAPDRPNVHPSSQETFIAPESYDDAFSKGNVSVQLVEVGTDVAPAQTLTVYLTDGPAPSWKPAIAGVAHFQGLDPTSSAIPQTDPMYAYDIRLAPNVNSPDDGLAPPAWAIEPHDWAIRSDVANSPLRARVIATDTTTRTLRVYQPATLTVAPVDDTTSAPITSFSVQLTITEGATQFTQAYTGTAATLLIDRFNQYGWDLGTNYWLVPGEVLQLVVTAPGYVTQSLEATLGPNEGRTETVRLVPATSAAVTFNVWSPNVASPAIHDVLPGSTVTVTGGALTAPLVLPANGFGTVLAELDVSALPYTATASGVNNFQPGEVTFTISVPSVPVTQDIDLVRPAGAYVVRVVNAPNQPWNANLRIGVCNNNKSTCGTTVSRFTSVGGAPFLLNGNNVAVFALSPTGSATYTFAALCTSNGPVKGPTGHRVQTTAAPPDRNVPLGNVTGGVCS